MSIISQFYAGSQYTTFSGKFGTGNVQFFLSSGTFTVPANITSLRVRLWGGGGGSTSGGTSSFGAYLSATGGQNSTTNNLGRNGGTGTGGDINTTGGSGGTGSGGTGQNGGGGGAATLFGNGGNGGDGASTSNPPNPGSNGFSGGGAGSSASTTNNNLATTGGIGLTGTPGVSNFVVGGDNFNASGGFSLDQSVINLDLIGCGSGGGNGTLTDNCRFGGRGVNGGGGGASSTSTVYSPGGFPGGGCGGRGSSDYCGGSGGGFSLKVITGLTPGDSIAVTVGAGGTNNLVAGGLVIVEW